MPHIRIPLHILFLHLLILFILYAPPTSANTEKIIFTTPSTLPSTAPNHNNVQNHGTLSPSNPRVLLTLPHSTTANYTTSFPSDEYTPTQLTQTLTLLLSLNTLQKSSRYEVRLIWAATTPIEDITFNIVNFDMWRGGDDDGRITSTGDGGVNGLLSVVIIRDMTWEKLEKIQDEIVEFVLDPYIYNIFPASLIHIVFMVVFIVGLAGWGSRFVCEWLEGVGVGGEAGKRKSVGEGEGGGLEREKEKKKQK